MDILSQRTFNPNSNTKAKRVHLKPPQAKKMQEQAEKERLRQ
jgi:hypothetical protein